MKYDFLIIGSGLFGCVLAENISRVLNKNVLIIEKRSHLGGNCFSEIDKNTNIEFHKYGTHIFHTNNLKVWSYINKFTKFNNYKHQVFSNYNNKIYQLPFNLHTINKIYNSDFNPEEAKKFMKKETQKYYVNDPSNLEEKAINNVGKKIYNILIKGYTEKQWGKSANKLPSSIINRIPFRYNYDSNYFNNSYYQGIPLNGYTNMFKNLLSNNKIDINFNTNFKINDLKKIDIPVIYTGPLDSFFRFKFGKLEWRSLKFKKSIINSNDYQGTSVINFPKKNIPYTRIHEPKHLHPERDNNYKKTLIIKEFPYKDDSNPYYPINDKKNRQLHRKYKLESEKFSNFFIGGRLADYAYYDMDMTISAALKLFENKLLKI